MNDLKSGHVGKMISKNRVPVNMQLIPWPQGGIKTLASADLYSLV
jgi:hypothetical protein